MIGKKREHSYQSCSNVGNYVSRKLEQVAVKNKVAELISSAQLMMRDQCAINNLEIYNNQLFLRHTVAYYLNFSKNNK